MTVRGIVVAGVVALAVGAAGAAAAACTDGDDDDGRPLPSSTITTTAMVAIGTVTLTADAPSARIAVPSAPVEDATELVVRVTELVNPNLHGIDLSFAVGDVEVGRVSPFPADRPTTFRVPLRGAGRDAMASGGSTVVVTLSSSDASLPLDPALRVVAEVAVG